MGHEKEELEKLMLQKIQVEFFIKINQKSLLTKEDEVLLEKAVEDLWDINRRINDILLSQFYSFC